MRKNCSGPIICLRAVGHIAVVIHHACYMGLPNEPMNILITRGAGTKRLVFSSSCAVYGDAQAPTIGEAHPKAPRNPYGLSKWQSEQVIAAVAPLAGIHYAALRYFNVIGNDPDGEVYEKHEPESHVVPNLIRAAQTGSPFNLYGTTHPTPDGTAIRDYVYVMDLAQAHIRALDVLESRQQLLSNVGTGSGTSVQELVHTIEQVFLTPVNTAIQPIREGDPPQLVADNTYLKTWFQHDFSSLTDVIRGLAGRAGLRGNG
jgi:UDP-arabinose 4-epimerase